MSDGDELYVITFAGAKHDMAYDENYNISFSAEGAVGEIYLTDKQSANDFVIDNSEDMYSSAKIEVQRNKPIVVSKEQDNGDTPPLPPLNI